MEANICIKKQLVFYLLTITVVSYILCYNYAQANREYYHINDLLKNECQGALGDLNLTTTNFIGHIESVVSNENNIEDEFGSIVSLWMASIDVLDSVECLLLQLESYARISNPNNMEEMGYLPISVFSDIHEQLVYEFNVDTLSFAELQRYLLSIRVLFLEIQTALTYAYELEKDPLEINYLFLEYLHINQAKFCVDS